MIDVTSLRLSKELSKAFPGWRDTEYVWREHVPNPELSFVMLRSVHEADEYFYRSSHREPEERFRRENKFFSAYDLGYLLRRIIEVEKVSMHKLDHGWEATVGVISSANHKTPEDAAGYLCLKLKKTGILK